MVTLYLKGQKFDPKNLSSITYFKAIQTLAIAGQKSKYGFIDNEKSTFGFGKLVINNESDLSNEEMLVTISNQLNEYSKEIEANGVEAISLVIISNFKEEYSITFNKEFLPQKIKIPYDIKIHLKKEIDKTFKDFVIESAKLANTVNKSRDKKKAGSLRLSLREKSALERFNKYYKITLNDYNSGIDAYIDRNQFLVHITPKHTTIKKPKPSSKIDIKK